MTAIINATLPADAIDPADVLALLSACRWWQTSAGEWRGPEEGRESLRPIMTADEAVETMVHHDRHHDRWSVYATVRGGAYEVGLVESDPCYGDQRAGLDRLFASPADAMDYATALADTYGLAARFAAESIREIESSGKIFSAVSR